jgi:hypothetical protein
MSDQQTEKARDRDISDGMLRQRRNLIAASIAMPLFFLSEATIEKVNLLGTVIKIENPEVISYAISGLFFYFLLRYFQYYNEENHIKAMKESMRENVFAIETRYLWDRAIQPVVAFKSSYIYIYYLDPQHRRDTRSPDNIDDQADTSPFPFFRRCSYQLHTQHGVGSGSITNFHEEMKNPPFDSWQHFNNGGTGVFGDHPYYQNQFTYFIFTLYIFRTLGFLKYLTSESYFTDYHLPFLLAAVSLLVTTYAVFV